MQNDRKPLFFALGAHLLLGLALMFRVPLGASPDEPAHWQYIEYIASHWRLPVFQGQIPPAPGYEFHQPPLYYAICAPFWALLPAGVENYSARFISLLCGLGTLVWLYRAGRIVFPKSNIAVYALLFAAFSPLHIGMGAGSNNDGLAGFFTAWMFYLMAKVWRDGPQQRDVILMGVVAALGLYTKTTTVTVSVVALLSLYFEANKHSQESGGSTFKPLIQGIGVALLVSLPLLARNQFIYGDPIGLKAFSAAASNASPGAFQFEQAGVPLVSYFRRMFWLIFLTFFGVYGGPNTAESATIMKPPGGRLDLLWSQFSAQDAWIWLLIIPCALFALASILGLRRLEDDEWGGVWKWWLSATLLVVLAWLQFAVSHAAGGQARYLHPAFVPLTLAFTAGFYAILPAKARPIGASIFGVVLLALTLLNVLVWKTLV